MPKSGLFRTLRAGCAAEKPPPPGYFQPTPAPLATVQLLPPGTGARRPHELPLRTAMLLHAAGDESIEGLHYADKLGRVSTEHRGAALFSSLASPTVGRQGERGKNKWVRDVRRLPVMAT